MTRPLAIAALGIAVRLYVGSLGYTQDLVYEAKHIDFYQHGGLSEVMNWSLIHYGPVQPLIILALAKLPLSLGTSMTLFDAVVDLWIAWMLWRWVSGTAATLFWLCPVTVIVGSFQRVPETLALGLGLAAVLVLEGGRDGLDNRNEPPAAGSTCLYGDWCSWFDGPHVDDQSSLGEIRTGRANAGVVRRHHGPRMTRTLVAALLLGLSLATKYDLVLLPVWLCLRRDA